jgi:CopG family nickel-responsive transcriptional regulator
MTSPKSSDALVRFGVAMPEALLEQFDAWSQRSGLPNRSEALRHLVRDFVSRRHWEEGQGFVHGTITLMYDHHSHDLSGALTSLQHDFGDVIVCTTHVHVTHETCLECLVLRGKAQRLKKLDEALARIKGLQNVGIVISAAA